MRLPDCIEHPLAHSAYAILADQHHIKPTSVQIANTTLSVSPLPGGPGVWDIALPFDAQAVIFSLRSNRTIAEASGKSGLVGVASRLITKTSCASIGGHADLAGYGAYSCVYSKAGGSVQLSHKIFASDGTDIALTDAWINLTGPTTRVLRTYWTNYGASYKTLDVSGQVAVLG